jgi:hypothetical protein
MADDKEVARTQRSTFCIPRIEGIKSNEYYN